MSNEKPKKKSTEKVITTQSIEHAFNEFKKGSEEILNNTSGVIDHKKFAYTIKMAKKAMREMKKLNEETSNNEKMAEDVKKKNKEYLKKKMG
jgi:hypothetical protein